MAMAVGSAVSSRTWATSFRRTRPPVGRGRIRSATSSTLRNLALVDTVRVWLPYSTSPAGNSRFSAVSSWAM